MCVDSEASELEAAVRGLGSVDSQDKGDALVGGLHTVSESRLESFFFTLWVYTLHTHHATRTPFDVFTVPAFEPDCFAPKTISFELLKTRALYIGI